MDSVGFRLPNVRVSGIGGGIITKGEAETMGTGYRLKAETGYINYSPYGFRRTAIHLLECYDAFKPESFSLVHYYLCCRAIELALKAMHMETDDGTGRPKKQARVKKDYSHRLVSSYEGLPPAKKTLSPDELDLLKSVDKLYWDKAFEYPQPIDAMHGYSDFPDLDKLYELAKKIVGVS